MGSAARRQLQIVPKKQFLVSPSERPPLISRLWKFVRTCVDFLVLVVITFASLTVWFVGESRDRHWAVLSFIDTVELHSLDARFRVRGARNLRVVDASVFPRIPGFFIVTNVYMISEKASDVIAEDNRNRIGKWNR